MKKKIRILLILLFSICFFVKCTKEQQQSKDTFSNVDDAFSATKKALDLLSSNLNEGQKSLLIVEEYKKTKKIIFK